MTATEKYHAVLEGKMKEGEFVRQMRQAFPQYITQWNGYKDSVTILKQKQLIFEKKEVKKDITALADSFPIEAIERGIDMELESAGIDSTGAVSKEEYMKAKHKAVSNLQKDANHYLNLISGESAKVDKNDKMKETKRGKLESDTFNAMKKATLKEEVDPSLDPYEDKKEIVRQVIDLVKREKSVPTSVAVDFVKTHYEDILNAHDDQAILDEFEEFFSVNYESGSDYNEVMGVNRKGEKQPETDGSKAAKYKRAAKGLEEDEEEYLAKRDAAIKKAMGKEDEVEEAVNAYTPGDMFSTDFDYEGMLKAGLKIRINTPVDTMQKIYDSFEDVNYHRENAHLGNVIDAVKDGDKSAALDALKSFRREIKNTMSDIFEGAFPVRERDENYVPRNGVVKERVATLDNFISLIQDKAGDSGFPEEEEAMEVIEAIAEHYGIKIQIGGLVGEEEDDGLRDDPRVDKHGNEEPEDGESSFGEAKGKDHDGDGDIDKDDYMAAKDKAIKKAMGKNESLKEDNTPRYPEGKLSIKDKIKAIVPLWKQYQSASGMEAEEIKDKISRYTAYDNEYGGGSYTLSIIDDAKSVEDVAKIIKKEEDRLKKDGNGESDYTVKLLVPVVYFNVESGELSDDKNEWYTDAELKAGADQTSYTKGTELDDVVFDGNYKQALDFAKRYPKLIKVVKSSSTTMGKKNEMLKENLKAIISKVLEEGTINEAATQELARIADDYAGFEGMKGAILDLQNLVSDIEAYYDKTREKIQKVYNTLGEIRNEEGLKVGGFLAPAIETAFMKDLRPVTKQGFTKGLDQPKVRVISQKDIDAHNSGERPLGEDEFSPEPKSTVFTPNI